MVIQAFEKYFQNLELFQDLPTDDLQKFLAECREDKFPANAVIFHEGAAPDRFYVLIDGQVEIWKDYGSPYADVLAVRGPGASFGEMSLIDDLPRSATVRTVTPVRLVSLDQAPFRRIMMENPAISLLIMKSVSRMVRVSNETFQYGLRQKNQILERTYEDLKRLQDTMIQNERLSTLGKFSSLIIHDLRNPISIIRGYTELLSLNVASPEKSTQFAAKLLNEIDRLNRMVGELLDYSRGDIRLNLAPVNLDELFHNLREQHENSLQSCAVTLEFENSVHDHLLLDRDRILRVFANLIDNARKAMRGGGTLTIRATPLIDSIAITVTDTGEGMPPEVQSRLFEPFFSASAAGGTGLGMLVVSNVVRAHQGSIRVESAPHCGTTIHMTFPTHLGSFG